MRKTFISLILSSICCLLYAGEPISFRVLSDTLTVTPSGYLDASNVQVEIENRCRNANLKDKVEMQWYFFLAEELMYEGVVPLDCPPLRKCSPSFLVDLHSDGRPASIRLTFMDLENGEVLLKKNYPIKK